MNSGRIFWTLCVFFIYTSVGLAFFGVSKKNETISHPLTEHEEFDTIIISDVDDTIKISRVRDSFEMVSYSDYFQSLFYGMNSVYNAINDNSIDKNERVGFFYLSNGWKPTVEGVHRGILNTFNFPDGEYTNRQFKTILKEKFNKILNKFRKKEVIIASNKEVQINKITTRYKPKKIIFIGDNGEKDPEIYFKMTQKIKDEYAQKGQQVDIHTYIHQVYDPSDLEHPSKLYEGQKYFSHPGELAAFLNHDEIITNQQTMDVLEYIKNEISTEGRHKVGWDPTVYPEFKFRGPSKQHSSVVECGLYYKKWRKELSEIQALVEKAEKVQ